MGEHGAKTGSALGCKCQFDELMEEETSVPLKKANGRKFCRFIHTKLPVPTYMQNCVMHTYSNSYKVLLAAATF